MLSAKPDDLQQSLFIFRNNHVDAAVCCTLQAWPRAMHACSSRSGPSPPTDGRRAMASLDARGSRQQGIQAEEEGAKVPRTAAAGGGPASRGVKRRRRFSRPQGWTVFQIRSSPWVPARRPIELGRPRLELRREASSTRGRGAMVARRAARDDRRRRGWLACRTSSDGGAAAAEGPRPTRVRGNAPPHSVSAGARGWFQRSL